MARWTLFCALVAAWACGSDGPGGAPADAGPRADGSVGDDGEVRDGGGADGSAGADGGVEADVRLEQWASHDFSVADVASDGDPFDELATASFQHQASGDTVVTEGFYAGDQTYRFRFTGSRLGLWTYTTSSAKAALDGLSGSVEVVANADPARRGFIVASASKWARQRSDPEDLEAYVPHVYMNFRRWGSMGECGWTPASTFAAAEDVTAYLDEAEAHGMNAIFALVATDWQQGVDPSLDTFAHLEQAIRMAHARGMHLHVWAWGDEARGWVPNGGVNEEADRRLQRYIAARLGPLPGWTMSYGFDLHEWVTPEEVRSWRDYLVEHMGWDHMLMARQEAGFVPLGLDVSATDARLDDAFYDGAVEILSAGRPAIFERRFTYRRDGVWDMDTTRRARWSFGMAGGAGAIWGHYPSGCTAHEPGDYPNPEQLVIQRRFFERFFRLDLERAPSVTAAGRALASPDDRVLVHVPDASAVILDLSGLDGAQPVVAVDALGASYEEIALGDVSPGSSVTVDLPHRSDWALAVGAYD